jgi:hypothetical protein
MTSLRHLLSLLAPLALSAAALAQGRIVVAHDEWTLSNNGFNAAPASTAQFARNVADWFTGGLPGNFRVWSSDFGFTGALLSQTMTGAGHTWTVATNGTFDLATLQQYDAVFLGVNPTNVDTTALTQYVQGGGCVYLCAGSGGASVAANAWNGFLRTFGLWYSNVYNNLNGLRAISSAHPLFAGVASLYEANGNSILFAGAPTSNAQILVATGTQGLYAVYDGRPAAPAAFCTAKLNSLGCTPAIGASGYASVSNPNPFNVTASNVLNQKQGLMFYGYAAAAAPFQGGTLCVQPPTQRTPVQGAGGASSPTNDCSGSYSIDFNAWIQSGVDPLCVAGQPIFAQYWSRDPQSPSTTGLTNGLSLVIGS